MGIFEKIYKYMNKESKEEREDRERKEFEREKKLLLGPGSIKTNMGSDSQELISKYRNPLDRIRE
jgi:hypothetical protein